MRGVTIDADGASESSRKAAASLDRGAAIALWQPYLKGNVWWGSHGLDAVTFATDAIPTQRVSRDLISGRRFDRGRLSDPVGAVADLRAAGAGDLAAALDRRHAGSIIFDRSDALTGRVDALLRATFGSGVAVEISVVIYRTDQHRTRGQQQIVVKHVWLGRAPG
jgi:hypothetical protein